MHFFRITLRLPPPDRSRRFSLHRVALLPNRALRLQKLRYKGASVPSLAERDFALRPDALNGGMKVPFPSNPVIFFSPRPFPASGVPRMFMGWTIIAVVMERHCLSEICTRRSKAKKSNKLILSERPITASARGRNDQNKVKQGDQAESLR